MLNKLKELLKNDDLYEQIIKKGIKESDLTNGWIPKDRFNEVNKELKLTKEKITGYEEQGKQLQTLLKDNEELKTKYGELETNLKDTLKNKDIEISNIFKSTKVENALIKEGCKHPDLLMSKIDLTKLSMENDNIIGLTDVLTNLKTNYSVMFSTQETNSTNTPKPSTPPQGDEGKNDWEFMTKL